MIFSLFPKYFSMCFLKKMRVFFYIIPVQVAKSGKEHWHNTIAYSAAFEPLISFITTTIKNSMFRIQPRIHPIQDPHCVYLSFLFHLQPGTLPQPLTVSLDLDIFEEYRPVECPPFETSDIFS